MGKKYSILFLAGLLLFTSLSYPASAEQVNNENAADVVILVDFSGSITEDQRYPKAEKMALENLVNVSWPKGSKIAILAFGAADSRDGGKPSTFPMCGDGEILRSAENINEWITSCTTTIGTTPVGPMTDHNKAIQKAVEILSSSDSINKSKFVLMMTDGKLDVDNQNPVNPDYVGTSEERDQQAIDELFLEVLPDAREKGIQIWPVGFGDVNRIELNGYAPEGGQPGPDSCQREIPRAVIAEPENLPYEINKIIRQVTCLGEYLQGDNVEVLIPDYADSATVNVKHEEGESFTLLSPDGQEINAGGEGTESTVDIPNPDGGNWQVLSDTPVTVGYWWESNFSPVFTCPEDSNIVKLAISPTNNSSNSYTNSPEFIVEVITNGEKQSFQLELGEEEEIIFEEDSVYLIADASVGYLDQPGIISFERAETECENTLVVTTPPVSNDIESSNFPPPNVENIIDCELIPDNPECKDELPIPWWLIVLILISALLLFRHLWKKRYLRQGRFVLYNNNGKQGSMRILKNTKAAAFNIDEFGNEGSLLQKSNPEVFGSYEITKGKKGSDFNIDGPTGSGSKQVRSFEIGDNIELEDGFYLEFEDGKNRKPIVVDNENPFDNQVTNDIFSTSVEDTKNNEESDPFA